jgi:hypothetical protein
LFYLFSVAGIWLALTRVPMGPAWFAGFGCLILSYLSLFAGVISIAVSAGALILAMVCERSSGRRQWLAVGLLALTFMAGMAIEPRFPDQEIIRASSVGVFFTALGFALAWPHASVASYGLMLHLPALILVVLLLLRRIRYSATLGFVVVLAAWAWLQAVGIAYARGFQLPQVRYLDILTVGLLASFTSALILVANSPQGIVRRLPAVTLLVAWILSAAAGLEQRTRESYASILPEKKRASMVQEFNLSAFVATGNRAYLDNKPNADIGYFGGADQVIAILTDPVIRPILPASIREPLPVRWPGAVTDGQARVAGPAAPSDLSDPDAFSTSTANTSGGVLHQESDWIAAPQLPFLQFRLAGGLGRHGLSLGVMTESGDLVQVSPGHIPLGGWTTVQVRSPRNRFRILVDDPSPNRWFAFSGPREMGPLSYYAEWLKQHATSVSRIGYACGVLFLSVQVVLLPGIVAKRKGIA